MESTTGKPLRMESNRVGRGLRSVINYACFAVAALIAAPAVSSESSTQGATRLLESSGFDEMLRLDAKRDGALIDGVPKSIPPELRAELAGAFDQTLAYAEMRRAMAEAISSRLDSSAIDRHLRWWASSTGQAVSMAHVTAFRELTELKPVSASRSANPAAAEVVQESPFALQLADLAETSHSTRDCLSMTVRFRRECAHAQVASTPVRASGDAFPDVVGIMFAQYTKLSDADLAAFRTYLKSPGSREVMGVLGDSYLLTRSNKVRRAQLSIADVVKNFAHSKIKGDSDATLRKVIALIDDDRSLEEAQLILHLLRSVEPRDPRILVELARVAMKQGPLIRRHTIPGEPPMIDPEFLEDAQRWLDRAIVLEPRRADTLVLVGHLSYLKRQFSESIAFLEQAREIGTSNPWLPLNLSDALWALGRDQDMDRVLMGRAAEELESALAKKLPIEMQSHANHSLAHIYGDLGDIVRGRAQFQRLISSTNGYEKASAWNDYAAFLFQTARDLDGAIAAAREATRFEFDIGHSLLSEALLVKAGNLYLSGQRADATKLVQEAQREVRDLERNYWEYARLPRTLPAVFALHEAGVIKDMSDSEGGLTLLYASGHAGAADIERLIKWRANPNYLDPEEGTPLQRAIRASNLAAVRTLLAHGADASVRDQRGRLPVELAERIVAGTGAKGGEILALLRDASKRNPAAAPVGAPLKTGFIYQALRRLSGDRFGHDLEVGTRVTFSGFCRYSDDNLACLTFKSPANEAHLLDVALPKEQLVSWQDWFKEIGPAPASAN